MRSGDEGTSRSITGEAKRGHDRLSAFLAIPPLDEKEKEAAEAVEDLRVLEVLFDSAEERFRSYDSAANTYAEHDFFDWPIDGPRSTYSVLKQLRRDGRTFLQQHDDWALRGQVDASNRAVHEHRLLSRALPDSVIYDQLAVPNLGCIEVMVRRRMLIERAPFGQSRSNVGLRGQRAFHGRPRVCRWVSS